MYILLPKVIPLTFPLPINNFSYNVLPFQGTEILVF